MNILCWFSKSKRLLLTLSLVLGTVLLGGCGGNDGSRTKENLTIGMTNAPAGFNPLFNPDVAAQFTLRFMYDTLLGMPEPNKFTPQLADSFETTDNQTYTIKLNSKAKWSDGQPITADDVVFTLNTIANPNVQTTKGSYINMLDGVNSIGKLENSNTIAGVQKQDDQTVVLKTKRPVDPNYIKCTLGFEIYIVPKHIFEKINPAEYANDEAVTKPQVTSGAFKFVDYQTNDHIELTANTAYYKGAPKLKKIFIRMMNGTNLVTELKSGNIQMNAGDGIGVIPVKDLDILKNDTNLDVKTAPSVGAQYMVINNSNPAFNVHFRRALTMSLNRQQIVDDLYKGTAQIVPTIYTKVSPVYDPNIKPLPYDLEQAKRELAQSGFDTSQEIVLQVPIGDILREQSADIIQQNLHALGLNVKQQKLDFPTVLSNARKGEYDLMLLGYGTTIDPDYSQYFLPDADNNFSHIHDLKLTEMMTHAALLSNFEERKSAYGKVQEYMRDNQFVVTLYSRDQIIVRSKKLKGGIKDFWEGSLNDVNQWHFE